MKKEDYFIKIVNDCADLKYDLKNNEYLKLNIVKKIFKAFFNKNPKEFMLYADSHIFNGGFPTQDSPSKLAKVSTDIAKLLIYYKFMGEEKQLEKYLNEFGIKLDLTNLSINNYILSDIDYTLDKKRKKIIDKNWSILTDSEFETDSNKLLTFLLDIAIKSKKKVFEINNNIIAKSEDIINECEVDKNNFLKAVNLKFKKLIGKDISEELNNLDDNLESLKTILNII